MIDRAAGAWFRVGTLVERKKEPAVVEPHAIGKVVWPARLGAQVLHVPVDRLFRIGDDQADLVVRKSNGGVRTHAGDGRKRHEENPANNHS